MSERSDVKAPRELRGERGEREREKGTWGCPLEIEIHGEVVSERSQGSVPRELRGERGESYGPKQTGAWITHLGAHTSPRCSELRL